MKSNLLGVGIVVTSFVVTSVSFAEDEAEVWSAELAVAITAQSGSTDTFSGTIDVKGERSWDEVDVVRLRFNGVYGTSRKRNNSTNTETIQNSQALFADWKHRIHDRFFWESGSELSRDNTQDRELRAALATGPGYRFWKGEDPPKHHFDITAGLGYRYEIYDGNTGSVPADNGTADHFADLVVAFEYHDTFFDDRIEYTHTGSGRVPVNDPGSYLVRSEVIVGVPVSESWSFRTSFLVEYVAEPGSDEVNNTATRTSVGLGYKF